MATPRDHTITGGGIGRHRSKQPLSHNEGIKMKNSKLNNGRKWISVDATDLFKLQNLVVQLSTELFGFQLSFI